MFTCFCFFSAITQNVCLFFVSAQLSHMRETVSREACYVCKQTCTPVCSDVLFVLPGALWDFNLAQRQVKSAIASIEESQIYSMQKLFKSFIPLNCTDEMFAYRIFVLLVLFQDHCESWSVGDVRGSSLLTVSSECRFFIYFFYSFFGELFSLSLFTTLIFFHLNCSAPQKVVTQTNCSYTSILSPP